MCSKSFFLSVNCKYWKLSHLWETVSERPILQEGLCDKIYGPLNYSHVSSPLLRIEKKYFKGYACKNRPAWQGFLCIQQGL